MVVRLPLNDTHSHCITLKHDRVMYANIQRWTVTGTGRKYKFFVPAENEKFKCSLYPGAGKLKRVPQISYTFFSLSRFVHSLILYVVVFAVFPLPSLDRANLLQSTSASHF